jgi:pyruvate dehydrogenase E2 component (dihydrolipoamide acetyltransferase)
MSDLIEIKVPDIGDSAGVEVIEVLIQAGDTIELEQTLLVMESDKASMDLPASVAGVVKEVKVKVGDQVSEGSLIALVESSGDRTVTEPAKEPAAAPIEEPSKPEPTAAVTAPAESKPTQTPVSTPTKSDSGSSAHASPSVRRFARELGVDLGQIAVGTGRKGRIVKQNVKDYVQDMMSGKSSQGGGSIAPIPAVDFSKFGATEDKKLSKIKRLTGTHLSRVWLNLPMVTHHDEADVTELEAFRKSLKDEAAQQGVRVTGMVFIMKALVAGMKQFPQFNSSLSADGQSLIYKKYFNIGIAVDTPEGLVVPVIKEVDTKGIYQLSRELIEISGKARDGKLMPADMQGGCMTISNLGGIGGTAVTPIVNAPEVAILGVTRAQMKPVWNGKEFIPREMMPLDLTYDHRVIDGADGARFTRLIAEYLGDLRRLLL